MLNGIFVVVAIASILLAAATGQMHALTDAILQDSRKAVDVSLRLVGVMAFFLGLMQVVQDAGLGRKIARLVAPVMKRLFPEIPPEHPAITAMIMNITSNMLGLGNAATPFGIKAMEELNKLNKEKGTATNSMVLFLAINTAGLAILPSGAIGLRAAAGSLNATGIWIPTWFASATATLVGILAVFALSRLPRYRATAPPVVTADEWTPDASEGDDPLSAGSEPSAIVWRRIASWLFWLVLSGLLVRHIVLTAGELSFFDLVQSVVSFWVLPAIVATGVLFGWSRGVPVYESLVEGAKEGFQVALRIIPFLVAILVAIGMFRASGWMELIIDAISPVTTLIGLPAEALPMAIIRPLSGSGAMGVMVESMNTYGPDSLIGYMVSTFQGSTETTFYVLAVYFGAVGVKRTRHTLPACLAADVAGILAAVFIVNLFFG